MQYILLVSCYRDSIIRNVKLHTVEADSFEQVKDSLHTTAQTIKENGAFDRVFCTITAGAFGRVVEAFGLGEEASKRGAHS